jgi:DNA-binding transcriptional LysR family regulator
MDIDRVERRLKVRDVRVLISVVQAGSMHKAAERLGTSQPAVSRSISDLERALGVRLLDRSRVGVEATQYGRAIIKRGIAAFDELRQGVKDIEFLADPSAGELRIGCTEGVASGPGFVIIDRLARQHPRIVFNVVTGGTAALYRNLQERNVELIMSGITAAIPQEFAAESLFDDSLVVAAGANSPWTRRRRIELAELINEPWTLLPSDSEPGALVILAFRAAGLETPKTSVITLSLNLRSRLLATGRYVTMAAGYTLLPGNSQLRALRVPLPNVRRTVFLVTLKNRMLSPLAELFVRTARDLAKAAPRPLEL